MKRLHDIAGKPRHLHGWKRGRVDERDLLMKAPLLARLRLPSSVDLRTQKLIKIEDQGDIGSCTCNSSTTALEWALRKAGIDVQLSRLYAYARVRELEGTPLAEDSGAEIRDVMKVLAKWGCPAESLWPYDLHKWTIDPPPAIDVEAAKHKLTMYYRCPTLATIKASLAQGFPVAGGFTVPSNMMSDECAKTGVVKFDPTTNEGGHAVCFVGYDDAKKWLIAANSWGEGWGDRGYFYLPFEFVTKGYASDFWTLRRGT